LQLGKAALLPLQRSPPKIFLIEIPLLLCYT